MFALSTLGRRSVARPPMSTRSFAASSGSGSFPLLGAGAGIGIIGLWYSELLTVGKVKDHDVHSNAAQYAHDGGKGSERAMAQAERGLKTHAQIQRRLTKNHRS